MALLQNEDFTTWQLRTSYLATIKDGIGDRLINVNSSVLNTPGFRAAGWGAIASANASHIKRTYSPPIPTTRAVADEYFQSASRSRLHDRRYSNDKLAEMRRPAGGITADDEDEDDEGEDAGMVTGRGRSSKTASRLQKRRDAGKKGGKRSRQRNLAPPGATQDDSSDLSDESDDESESAAQQIKFTKMPVRTRSGSSPIRGSERRTGPQVLVTSPSVRSGNNRYRRSSLGAVESLKGRPRRDTTTSSDLSSENENDLEAASSPRSKQIHFSSQEEVITPKKENLHDEDAESEKLEEELEAEMETGSRDEDSMPESVDSGLFSEFSATAGSGSLLNRVGIPRSLDAPSSPLSMNKPAVPNTDSPKKWKASPSELNTLPPPRPISTIKSTSALTAMLKSRKQAPTNPLDKFAVLSGKNSTTPLYVKIYVPASSNPMSPLDMPIVRESKDSGSSAPVTIAEAIGLALWKYVEDGVEPALGADKLNVNRWNLRLVEDGEVDYDFAPLLRNRPIADFTSNNNRAAGMRGRSRSKLYDEFALVETTAEEFKENEKQFPKFSTGVPADVMGEADSAHLMPAPPQPVTTGKSARSQPILGQPFPSALNDSSLTPADRPAVQTSHATPRMGTMKTLKIRYIDTEQSRRVTTVSTSTDSYIAEILDSVCKRWGLDKGSFVLKVVDSNTVVPLDRTVEALGGISNLDVVRRRFPGGPISLTGSPVSASPNAPLMVENEKSSNVNDKDPNAKKGKKGRGQMFHPLAQQQDVLGGYYRRYQVIRKQSMGFTASNQRVLIFDNDYMHIMPWDTQKTLFESPGKTRSISFADVVGSKVSRRHPKSFRVVVLRGNDATEQKRYDFEAKSAPEAVEIVDEIKKKMQQYQI